MVPLELVPLPQGLQPGTKAFLEAFRALAIPREQAWIRRLNTGYPRGLNLEVHQGNPLTWQRRLQRKRSTEYGEWQQVPVRHPPTTNSENSEPDFWMDEKGLHFSRKPGLCAGIRRNLATLLEFDENQKQT